MFMIDFLIPNAMAAEGGFPGSLLGPDLLLIVGLVLMFYFLLWRPNSKRQKEHKELVGGLAKGDEIVTNGGLVGRIIKVEDQFIVFEAADGVELKLQKSAVTQALPKGTIKSI